MPLTIEIINKNDLSFSRKAENLCLKPLRYLLDGRTYVILNNQIVNDAPSFYKRNFIGVAGAVATLIPGLIFGVLAHIFIITFSKSYTKDRVIIDEFSKREIQLPVSPPLTLAQYELKFYDKMDRVLDKIKEDRAIWQDKQFILDFSDLVEDGYKHIDIYFREIAAKCHLDAKLMVAEMILQPQIRKVPGQDYSHTFFKFSLLYHFARSCSNRMNRQEFGDIMGISKNEPMPLEEKRILTEEDQDPYFNPTKPQYRWRELYNTFCSLVDKNGVRTRLQKRDARFSNWSRPDLRKVENFYFPDTLPT